MSKKFSQFTVKDIVADSDYVNVTGSGVNRRVAWPDFLDNIYDRIVTPFIYPTIAALQEAPLRADEDDPVYVRVEETEYRLYKITNIAPGEDDIVLENGNTATAQTEYRDIGFVVGPETSSIGALATYDNETGTLLAEGPTPSTVGVNLIEFPDSSSDGFFRKKNDNTLELLTGDMLKDILNLENVDNTSDLNKPISTATQAALDLKASIDYVDAADNDLQAQINDRVQSVATIADLKTITGASDGQEFKVKDLASYYKDGSDTTTAGNDTIVIQGNDGSRYKATPIPDFDITFYVSTTGSDSNSGLSESQAFLTPQRAADEVARWASFTRGQLKIKLAAGTYTSGILLDGVKSWQEILIEGTLSGSVPATIFTGMATAINCNYLVNSRVKWIKTENCSVNGIVFQNGSVGVIEQCDQSGCTEFGWNASEFSDMTIIGTCNISVPAGGRGLRWYRQSTGSLGDGTNTITLEGNGNVADGIQVRDNSNVVANNGIIVDDFANYGVIIYKQSYLELRDCTISDNATGIAVDSLSVFANLSGTITYTGNTKDITYTGFSQEYGAVVKSTVIGDDGPSPQAQSGNYDLVITNDGSTGIQALTNGGGFNIDYDITTRISFATDTTIRMTINNAEEYRFTAVEIRPSADNVNNLGAASFRFGTVYAGTGTINTSDERLKSDISEIDAAVLKAWGKVNYCQYKFNDAIERKGDSARYHFGVIAQRVKEAFESEGLDAFDYGLLCYDKWEESVEDVDDGVNRYKIELNAGDRYGIRYEEALALECAYLRSKLIN